MLLEREMTDQTAVPTEDPQTFPEKHHEPSASVELQAQPVTVELQQAVSIFSFVC